jgi:flagellar protein FlbD
MIQVKRLDGQDMILNAELIFSIQKTPDTLICFTTGERLMVREDMNEVMARVMEYRRTIHISLPQLLEQEEEEEALAITNEITPAFSEEH